MTALTKGGDGKHLGGSHHSLSAAAMNAYLEHCSFLPSKLMEFYSRAYGNAGRVDEMGTRPVIARTSKRIEEHS
jgi:hypothetical protein